MFVYSADRPARDHESITVSNVAAGIGISASKMRSDLYGPCVGAFFTNKGAVIRFWLDGTAPTTTEGHRLSDGQNLTLSCESDVRGFLAIKEGSTDSILSGSLRY